MWPSENVAQGGIFHARKNEYNKNNSDFLKELIKESQLAAIQRDKNKYILRNNDYSDWQSAKPTKGIFPKVSIRPGSPKRRSLDSIIRSGAFELENYQPKRGVDREMQKKLLQDKMIIDKSQVDKITSTKQEGQKIKIATKPKSPTRFEQLKLEIQERQDFLAKMDKFGEADKHRHYINLEIQARLKEIQDLSIE